MVLDSDQILKADDTAYEEVEVPEWGGTVRVRSLTGYERDQYEQSIRVEEAPGKFSMNLLNARAKIACLTLVDDEGNRLFKDGQEAELGRRNAFALNRIFEAACRLSGLTEADVKKVEEGLEGGPTEGPSSDSHLSSVAQ